MYYKVMDNRLIINEIGKLSKEYKQFFENQMKILELIIAETKSYWIDLSVEQT